MFLKMNWKYIIMHVRNTWFDDYIPGHSQLRCWSWGLGVESHAGSLHRAVHVSLLLWNDFWQLPSDVLAQFVIWFQAPHFESQTGSEIHRCFWILYYVLKYSGLFWVETDTHQNVLICIPLVVVDVVVGVVVFEPFII